MNATEAKDQVWKLASDLTQDMARSEYKEFLEEMESEADARLTALADDEVRDEE